MMMRSARTPRRPLRALPVLLLATACGAEADCIVPPCALPLAIEVTVTGGAGGLPMSGATIAVAGPLTGGGPCQGSVCHVLGPAGTYEIDVGAPGHATVHRQVVVPGTHPECGCPTVEAQRLTVALPPVVASLAATRYAAHVGPRAERSAADDPRHPILSSDFPPWCALRSGSTRPR